MSVREEPSVGSELAGYRIEALLGRGGMAVVYRAEDLRLGRPVALKLLAPALAEDEGFRERFLRESRLAASIDHPNVIPIYEAGEADGRLFIAMRYVEGTDLATVLDCEGVLRPARALALLGPVASALDAGHGRGLVHRDVKPGNILIAVDRRADPPEHVYLSDFGLTKRAASESGLTQTGQLVGTPEYVAPEQLARAPLDGRADLYSFGCVLFECLTGEPPFHDESLMAVLWAHVNDQPPRASERRPELPERIDAVLARAMAKRPDERYATCREFAAAAGEALGLPAEAPPRVKARRPLRRVSRRALALLTVGLAGGAAALSAFLVNRDGAPRGLVPIPPNSVVIIDPGTNEVVDAIAVGASPDDVEVAKDGRVYVLNPNRRTVSVIDPGSRSVAETFGAGDSADAIAVNDTGLWVADAGAGHLTGFTPEPQRVRVADDDETAGGAAALAAEGEVVWVLSWQPRGLIRVEVSAVGPTVTKRIALEREPAVGPGIGDGAVALGAGFVWVANFDGSLSRIDGETDEVRTVELGKRAATVAFGHGSVWVTLAREDAVTRVDPHGLEVRARIPVGDNPRALAVGAGSVWVASGVEATVSRIDPRTNEVAETIAIGRRPEGIAVGEGLVWVTVRPSGSS